MRESGNGTIAMCTESSESLKPQHTTPSSSLYMDLKKLQTQCAVHALKFGIKSSDYIIHAHICGFAPHDVVLYSC